MILTAIFVVLAVSTIYGVVGVPCRALLGRLAFFQEMGFHKSDSLSDIAFAIIFSPLFVVCILLMSPALGIAWLVKRFS